MDDLELIKSKVNIVDLASTVDAYTQEGARFRNDIATGVGGKQILLEDPSGNPIELFEPTIPEASLSRPSWSASFHKRPL